MTSSHKLGLLLILVGLAWGLYLIRLSVVFEETKHRESETLKRRIIELSKEYITALSKEHALDKVEVPKEGRSMHPREFFAQFLSSLIYLLSLLASSVLMRCKRHICR